MAELEYSTIAVQFNNSGKLYEYACVGNVTDLTAAGFTHAVVPSYMKGEYSVGKIMKIVTPLEAKFQGNMRSVVLLFNENEHKEI